MALNIKGIAESALGIAYRTTEDVWVEVTLLLTSRIVSDVGNDDPSGPSDATAYVVDALKYQTREQRLAEDASQTTTFLIRVIDLVRQGFERNEVLSDGDEIMEGVTKWTVYRADVDPAGAAWILLARR